jgi:hypothetical protein
MENNIEQPVAVSANEQASLANETSKSVISNTGGAIAANLNEGSEQESLGLTSNDGSINNGFLGKFKDVESLSKAYAELESQFTKKSQRLSQLEKDLNALKSGQSSKDAESALLSENTKQGPGFVPLYQREDWRSKVDAFLSNNPKAIPMSHEIASLIVEDSGIANSEYPLELAFSKILAKKYTPVQALAESEEFLENYIYKNDAVKSKIIEGYLKELSLTNAPPMTISDSGGEISITPPNKPASISEAGKMAYNFFKAQ